MKFSKERLHWLATYGIDEPSRGPIDPDNLIKALAAECEQLKDALAERTDLHDRDGKALFVERNRRLLAVASAEHSKAELDLLRKFERITYRWFTQNKQFIPDELDPVVHALGLLHNTDAAARANLAQDENRLRATLSAIEAANREGSPNDRGPNADRVGLAVPAVGEEHDRED